MSTTEPFPAAGPAPRACRRRSRARLRRVFFVSALLLTGGVIGAVVAGPTIGAGRHGGPPTGITAGATARATTWRRRPHVLPRPDRARRRAAWLGRPMPRASRSRRSTRSRRRPPTTSSRCARSTWRRASRCIDTLAAPTVDRAKLETLRADQMKLAETATKRVTDAVADIADVLTPAQRAELGQRVERWQRWFQRLSRSPCSPKSPGRSRVWAASMA